METKRYQRKDIEKVAALLKEGKVVAFPTDTVYGLAIIYENEQALEALKACKGRPENKPIPTMVSSLAQIQSIAITDARIEAIVKSLMPGALTIICKKQSDLPDYITNGFDTVAMRMPNDDFILHLIDLCEKPLLVTSANLSGEQPGKTAEEVLEQLDGRMDAIVMGSAQSEMASTIVDLSKDDMKIVRQGIITQKQIEEVIKKR